MKRLFCLAMFGCAIACGGNAAESAPPGTPPGQNGSAVKAPGDAKVGDTTRCPVTGEEFVVEVNSPKVDYQGSTYYFCCSSCKKKFEASPEKFVQTRPSARVPAVLSTF